MKALNKILPSAGNLIFYRKDKKILSKFLPEKSLKYPLLDECKKNSNGSLNWRNQPDCNHVAQLMNYAAENGYINHDMMAIMGLNARAVRGKKTTDNIELQQFILLCDLVINISNGNTDYRKPIFINKDNKFVERNGNVLPDNWYD